MDIEVYTDGSATVPTKPGGWAYVIVIDSQKHSEGSGHMEGASNNDAELEAAVQGLAAALKYQNAHREQYSMCTYNVTLCSDSQLVLGWASGKYQFKQVSKLDKYKQLQFLVSRLNAGTRWVEGHSGHEHNERCDKLANEARLGIKQVTNEPMDPKNTLIGKKKSGTICLYYKNSLKVIDLDKNIVENYDRETHGPRGGTIEIREEKSR